MVVLSYDYWVNRFAKNPNVLGQKILVNNFPMTIVGVSAEGFAGLDPSRTTQHSRPHSDDAVIVPNGPGCIWTIAAPLGPGLRAPQDWPDRRDRRTAMQVLFKQIRTYSSRWRSS